MKNIIIHYLLWQCTSCLVKIAPKKESSKTNLLSNNFRRILFSPIALSITALSKDSKREFQARLLAKLISATSLNFVSSLKVEIVPEIEPFEHNLFMLQIG